LSASGGAWAEPLYSFDTTPSKLPKSVIPSHYAIELAPDLQALTTAGREIVDIDVREQVERIVLNAVNTEISEATIDDGGQRAEVSYDPRAETATRVRLATPRPTKECGRCRRRCPGCTWRARIRGSSRRGTR